jgi:general secretion pathway protein G
MRNYSSKNPEALLTEAENGLISPSCCCRYSCESWLEHKSEGYSLVELLIAVAIMITLAAIAIPSYSKMIDTARMTSAMGDIKHIQFEVDCFYLRNNAYPVSLEQVDLEDFMDPWGRAYEYLKIEGLKKGKGQVRKDKNLVPLNSDYDLYSMGPDGASMPPITAKASRDDIIRANNGGFVGFASNY